MRLLVIEDEKKVADIAGVYARHLRNKVDDPCPVKLIRTVRGAGYAISDESRS